MTVLDTTCIGVGLFLLIGAAVWSVRTRHERKLWRTTRYDTSAVAIVLELEERVHALDTSSTPVR